MKKMSVFEFAKEKMQKKEVEICYPTREFEKALEVVVQEEDEDPEDARFFLFDKETKKVFVMTPYAGEREAAAAAGFTLFSAGDIRREILPFLQETLAEIYKEPFDADPPLTEEEKGFWVRQALYELSDNTEKRYREKKGNFQYSLMDAEIFFSERQRAELVADKLLEEDLLRIFKEGDNLYFLKELIEKLIKKYGEILLFGFKWRYFGKKMCSGEFKKEEYLPYVTRKKIFRQLRIIEKMHTCEVKSEKIS